MIEKNVKLKKPLKLWFFTVKSLTSNYWEKFHSEKSFKAAIKEHQYTLNKESTSCNPNSYQKMDVKDKF